MTDMLVRGANDGGTEARGVVVESERLQAEMEAVDSSGYAPSPSAEELENDPASFATPDAPPEAQVNLQVPYIHQLWDTPDDFNGEAACGPTSVAMVLAYYGVLEPKPMQCSKPYPHTSDYGYYIARSFEHTGRSFNAKAQGDYKGNVGQGLYGAVVHNKLGQVNTPINGMRKGITPTLRHFLEPRGNMVKEVYEPSWRDLARIVGRGTPCHPRGNVFGYAHILVVRYWYDEPHNAYHWIINDPHGYMNQGRYNGENVSYRWWELHKNLEKSKWMWRISGPE